MRICTRCGGENTTKTQKWCSQCKREYDERYYSDPQKRQAQIDRVRLRDDRIRQENRQLVFEYLLYNPCIDCGEADPTVLQFDHQSNKHKSICEMIGDSYSWTRVLEEIQKCKVRCANCHARKTAAERGFFRHLASLAQQTERRASTSRVVGANPTGGTCSYEI